MDLLLILPKFKYDIISEIILQFQLLSGYALAHWGDDMIIGINSFRHL